MTSLLRGRRVGQNVAIVLKGYVIGTVTGGMGEGLKILKGSGHLLSMAPCAVATALRTTRYSLGIWLIRCSLP